MSAWTTALLVLASASAAQQPVTSFRGVVRDPSGAPLAGTDVFLDRHQTTTGAQGAFLLDSLKPGDYQLTIRRVGYSPVRNRITLPAGPTVRDFVLQPAPVILPTLVTVGRRTGIYGTVADTSHHAAIGARVQVLGNRGGEVLTDSAGVFSFPDADQGAYLVRITFPGYLERRLTLELARGEGRELAVRLTPGLAGGSSHSEAQAFQDLRLRLAMSLRRERLTASGMEVFGATQLCEMPTLRLAGSNPVIVLNGTDIYRDKPRTFLCFWRADEIELLEFGSNICKEASGTVKLLVQPRCFGMNSKGSGGGYIMLWEKK